MEKSIKRILIAEDEQALSRVLSLKLINSGFLCDIASDGKDALSKIETVKYDLVLLDLVMPIMDGFNFLKGLDFLEKRKVIAKKPLVIVLSNLSQKSDMDQAKALGAIDFFIKSDIQLADLIKHINKVLQ
jgi:DNA-binding response OmpR family regulator